jgi:magnesium-transporting ATPase (P-type)
MEFPEHKKDDILNNAVSYYMAAQGLKVISYSFKDIPISKFNEMLESYDNNLENPEFRTEIENDLCYLCTFGLQDPLRTSIDETNQLIKYGNTHGDHSNKSSTVNIKMVTGDHIETAKWVGVQSGLITEEDAKDDGICMTGEDFNTAIGPW